MKQKSDNNGTRNCRSHRSLAMRYVLTQKQFVMRVYLVFLLLYFFFEIPPRAGNKTSDACIYVPTAFRKEVTTGEA